MARSVELQTRWRVLTNRSFAIKSFCTPAAQWIVQFSLRLLAAALPRARFIPCKLLADAARRSWKKLSLRSKAIAGLQQLRARLPALWGVCRSPSMAKTNLRITLRARWSLDTAWV